MEVLRFFDPSSHGTAAAAAVVALIVAAIGISVFAFVFWIWMLVNAIITPKLDGTQRVLWVLGMWFLPIIITIVYFFAVYAPGGSTPSRASGSDTTPSDTDFTY
jgi:hypothetical protein